jgi:hypothetical protein
MAGSLMAAAGRKKSFLLLLFHATILVVLSVGPISKTEAKVRHSEIIQVLEPDRTAARTQVLCLRLKRATVPVLCLARDLPNLFTIIPSFQLWFLGKVNTILMRAAWHMPLHLFRASFSLQVIDDEIPWKSSVLSLPSSLGCFDSQYISLEAALDQAGSVDF